jgi:hypothetical protein
MTSPTGRRECVAERAADRAPLQPPPPSCPFPLPTNQIGQQIPQDPFAGPAVAGPSNARYQPHAPPGQARPSVDRRRADQPPELSPREQVAAIRSQLAAEAVAMPSLAGAASGQAGPSVDRRRPDQPPELSPHEQLAAIRAQLAAESAAVPPLAPQWGHPVQVPMQAPLPALPAG